MSDAEWQVLGPEATELMAQIRLAPGRPMDHPVRSMLDAVRYLVRNRDTVHRRFLMFWAGRRLRHVSASSVSPKRSL
jgi:hypothetical protein